jgi:hypothetical protein
MKQIVSNQMGDGQIVKAGNDIPTSYDNFILHDLEQSIVIEGRTLDEHYDHVMTSLGNSYKGANKYAYGNIIQAIKTVVTCKKTHPRRTEKCIESVGYLHQDMQMASNSIQNTLLLYGVKLTTRQILGYSEKVLTQRDPSWILKFAGLYYV